jgi:uncharacterized protein
MKILLIHGFKSSPSGEFFPWLADSLRNLGHEVSIPELPDADAPDPEAWTKALLDEMPIVDDETIILGHSLGGAQALRYLEAAEARSTPKACILISTPWMIRADELRGFFMSELDFDVLMWKASRFSVIHSADDKIIPFDHAQKYAKALQANLIECNEGEGHFQGKEYACILNEVKRLIDEEIIYEPGLALVNEYADVKVI